MDVVVQTGTEHFIRIHISQYPAIPCLGAELSQARSTNGVFGHVVAAADGLHVKAQAPSDNDTLDVVSFYSGSKAGYRINVQAMCTAKCRVAAVSAITPGGSNDWVAWNPSTLSEAVDNLPDGYHILGDAAYPLSEKIMTPYPGKNLPPDKDSLNFHLSQLVLLYNRYLKNRKYNRYFV